MNPGKMIVVSPAILLISLFSAITMAQTPDRDWPMHRHDTSLSARTKLPGDFKTPPQVAWKFPLQGFRHFAEIEKEPGIATGKPVTIPPNSADFFNSPEGQGWRRIALDSQDPKAAPPKKGKKKVQQNKMAQLIPGRPGPQVIAWELVKMEKGLDVRQAVCYTVADGKRTEEWRSEPFDTIQNQNHIIADTDGDGQLDVILAPHYRVIVLDGRTGKTKFVHKIHDMRNYGFFCAVNLDDDPQLEFVILADFAMHMDVIDNDGKSLKTLWRYDFEDNIQNKNRIVRPGADPVQDLDGDGRKELLFNYFNESGDGHWHLVAYDALTGNKVFDLPETYLVGTSDLDGDGKPELFCCATSALYTPESGRLMVYGVEKGKPALKWENDKGHWLEGPQPLPLTHSTIVAHGDWNIDSIPTAVEGHEQVFYVESEPSAEGISDQLLSLRVSAEGKLGTKWIAGFPRAGRLELSLEAFKENGPGKEPGLLVSYNALDSKRNPDLHIAAIDTIPAPAKRKGVLITHLDGIPVIVTETGGHEIVALKQGSDLKKGPDVIWKEEGVGPAVLADVTGDGKPEAIFSDWAISGEGEIVARSLSDAKIWKHVISGFPGPDPDWNFGGVTTWSVGHFLDKTRYDIFCTARRSTMHSDEGWVISTTKQSTVWHRRETRTNHTGPNERGWGCGGTDVCAFDVDGDGLDDVVSLYPVDYMAAKGTDGSLIHSIDAAAGLFENVWGAYAMPTIADYNRDGKPELLWAGPYHHGLTTLDAKVLWCQPGGAGPATAADIDGDGKMELASTGWKDGKGLRILDAATGSKRWDVQLPTNDKVEIAAADIDGDGGDDFLVPLGNELYAVNARGGSPHVIWKTQLPSPASEIAMADIDGDGKAEILYVGADSNLYCLAAKK